MAGNAEILQSIFEAYNRGFEVPDPAALRVALEAFCDPDVVWEENVQAFSGLAPMYRGHDGIIRWLNEVMEAWDELRLESLEVIEAGDHLVAHIRLLGKGRGSGIPVDMRIYNVFKLRDGKIARRRIFFDRAEALKAAGVTETEPG
jgi:ketosteroid isomerase-like protein